MELLLLLLLISTTSWAFVPDDPEFSRSFYQQDSSREMVENFLRRFVSSLESQDPMIIDGLLTDSFVFKGCKGHYDKEQSVDALSQLPLGTNFTLTLTSIEDNGYSIRYGIIITGFSRFPIDAEFVLCKRSQQLELGIIKTCTGDSNGSVQKDSLESMVRRFLDRVERSIESKDVSIISGLFKPDFKFMGCRGTYSKAQVVGILQQVPAGSQFKFNLKSVEDLGFTVKYTVTVTGFGMSEIEMAFLFGRTAQQLERGFMVKCPGHQNFMFY
ncbi:hypothetical protein L5515_000354 [Caenorhabditis briggsae]|uniref:NTF2-like domain-containing protein n=1 Tax=Caenorhabditis briggsae TaxID=6238 RepID=A0AAE9DZ91_CAEBR|nr:hypothetical protein L5515_000354 [Caenorhabditis briggsae]